MPKLRPSPSAGAKSTRPTLSPRAEAAIDNLNAKLDQVEKAKGKVRRENKTLSNEIKDIMDLISEGGRSICKIDKVRKRLEAGKLELQSIEKEAPLPATPRPR